MLSTDQLVYCLKKAFQQDSAGCISIKRKKWRSIHLVLLHHSNAIFWMDLGSPSADYTDKS